MIIRMIPVSGLFRRMIRLVHDLSVKSGKKVDLRLSGESTEVDKTVIETITDPLVHILRKLHGPRPLSRLMSALRLRKMKPVSSDLTPVMKKAKYGLLWKMTAAVLNKEKILAKAITNGLVDGDGSDLTDKEIYQPDLPARFLDSRQNHRHLRPWGRHGCRQAEP